MQRFRDIVTYWSKIAKNHTHLARSLRIFRRVVPYQKMKSRGYQMVYISRSCIRSARHNIPACDGQTDGQTRRCRKDLAMHSVARVKSVGYVD